MTELEWRHVTAAGAFAGDPRRRRSVSSRLRLFARDLRTHRRALAAFTISRFRATYRAQSLGIIWPIANPFILMVVMSVVFGVVFRNEVHAYPVFLMLGLVVWQFVTHAWTEGTSCLVVHAGIVKRTAVPSYVVALGTVLSHIFTLGFASLSILPLIAVYPNAFHVTFALLLVPLHVGLVVLMTMGLVLGSSVLHVLYRDVGYIVDSLLLVLFWATPVMWPMDFVPASARPFLLLNPITSNLQCIRDIVLKGTLPPASVIGAAVVGSLVTFVIGAAVYHRAHGRVADHV